MTQPDTATTVEAPPAPQEVTHLPSPLTIKLGAIEMTDDQLVQVCADNAELRIEMTAERELIIMPPTNSDTGRKELTVSGELYIWSKQDGTGVSFSSSTGFTLPNGAMRSPDASWIRRERWEALPESDRNKFAHIAPDFVIELRSPSDSLSMLQSKMAEYMENGVRLGLFIDSQNRRLYIYRPGQPVQALEGPETVSGEDVLPGFQLNLQQIW